MHPRHLSRPHTPTLTSPVGAYTHAHILFTNTHTHTHTGREIAVNLPLVRNELDFLCVKHFTVERAGFSIQGSRFRV